MSRRHTLSQRIGHAFGVAIARARYNQPKGSTITIRGYVKGVLRDTVTGEERHFEGPNLITNNGIQMVGRFIGGGSSTGAVSKLRCGTSATAAAGTQYQLVAPLTTADKTVTPVITINGDQSTTISLTATWSETEYVSVTINEVGVYVGSVASSPASDMSGATLFGRYILDTPQVKGTTQTLTLTYEILVSR